MRTWMACLAMLAGLGAHTANAQTDGTTATATTTEATATTAAPAPPPAPADAAAPASAGTAQTAAARDDDEDDDGERRRFFWIDAAIGYSYINLVALNQDNFVPEPDLASSSGMTAEAGLGIQFSVVRLGLAGTYSRYQGFDAATAELDLGIVIPLPIVQPYIETGIGYGWIGNVGLENMVGLTADASIDGIAVDLGLGVDFVLSDLVQLGVGVDASLLNLQRQKVTALGTITGFDFTQDGSALGIQVHGVARLTLQF